MWELQDDDECVISPCRRGAVFERCWVAWIGQARCSLYRFGVTFSPFWYMRGRNSKLPYQALSDSTERQPSVRGPD